MKPGLARAVPMGILGFIIGALIAIVIRLLQGLDPNPNLPYAYVGPAFVLGTFISAGFFVWGMGAFDPRMSVHGEEHEEEHAEETHVEPEKPVTILTGHTWQIVFWTIVLVVSVAAFAFLPYGPTIRSVEGNDGNVAAIGYTTLGQIYTPIREFVQAASRLLLPPLADNLASIQISYLTLFILLSVWTVFSLFVAGGAMSGLFHYLSRGAKNADAVTVPWRPILFVLFLVGLVQLPILVPNMIIPTALIMPAFVLPPLILLIVYRRPIFALLLLLALPLPILVPAINLSAMAVLFVLLLIGGLVVASWTLLRFVLPEAIWRPLATLIYALGVLAMIVLPLSAAMPDFWQMLFLFILVVLGACLLLPLWFLKLIIPASVWSKFAAMNWPMAIPQFAGWLGRVLRDGLPKFVGQR